MTHGTDTATMDEEVMSTGRAGSDPALADDGGRAHGETVLAASEQSVPRWLIRLGWALLALQLAYLMSYSLIEYQRFALSWDFASYHQAWYLIGHGELNPNVTAYGGDGRIWHNNGESLLWPLAILGIPFGGNSLAMLWFQDLAIVGTGAVAFSWVLDLTRRPSWPSRLPSAWAVGTALVLLLCNPWLYWTAAFDFHMEVPGALFLILTARALERRRYRSCAVWAILTMLCGAIMAAMVAGLGIGAVLAGRRWRRVGLSLVAAGVSCVAILAAIGLKGGNLSVTYGYLAEGKNIRHPVSLTHLVLGTVGHPERVVKQLWQRRLNIFANIAPAGLVGVLTPWGFGVSLVVLAANNLPTGIGFSPPIFQYFPMYAFVVIGTVYFLASLTRRYSWGPSAAKVLCGALMVSTLGWSLVWLPQTYTHWLRVSPAAASVLTRVEAEIPPQAEVIASQGIAGRFSSRKMLYVIFNRHLMAPVDADPVYFVVTAYQGTETASVNAQLGLLWYIAGTLHARLIASGADVWAFRWDAPPSIHKLDVYSPPTVPGWALPSAEGKAVLAGPVADWHMVSGPAPGYVVDQAYWREPRGRYVATVALASSGPATIEVRNADSGVLLASRHLTNTDGLTDVFVDANNLRTVPPSVFAGSGPFQIDPIPPPSGDQLEVRVFSPARSEVSVYSVELIPEDRAPAASHLGE